VGTVVGPVNEGDQRRWKFIGEYWVCLQDLSGKPSGAPRSPWSWRTILNNCDPAGVREYPDSADPDGYQSELDALRADVERLNRALVDAAENLTQAEKDRDDNAQNAQVVSEQLSRAQRERGQALQEAAALRRVLASIRRVAEQSVPGSAVES